MDSHFLPMKPTASSSPSATFRIQGRNNGASQTMTIAPTPKPSGQKSASSQQTRASNSK